MGRPESNRGVKNIHGDAESVGGWFYRKKFERGKKFRVGAISWDVIQGDV